MLHEITEDTSINYKNDKELTYMDFNEDYISLYVKNKFKGDCKVWQDSEMNNREYIILNHTIVYLDNLNQL